MSNTRPTLDETRRVLVARVIRACLGLAGVIAIGTCGYVALGGGRWSWADAVFMTVITLSTVGYGELPGLAEVPGGRWFTVGLILVGSGVLLYAMSSVTAFIVEGDLQGILRRRAMDRRIDGLREHVILCGLGATGGHVAAELHASGTRYVAVDLHPDKVDRMSREHGIEPLLVHGDATEESVLERAGIHRAAGLIAALTDDRDNLFLTFTARAMNPQLRIVAKAVEPDNEPKIRRAGADEVINPTWLGGVRMVGAMHSPAVVRFMDEMIRDRSDPHRVEEFTVGEASPVAGRRLREAGLRAHGDALVLGVRSVGGRLRYNPAGDEVLVPGDTLLVLARTDAWADLDQLLTGRESDFRFR